MRRGRHNTQSTNSKEQTSIENFTKKQSIDGESVTSIKVTELYTFCYVISYSTIGHIKCKTEVINKPHLSYLANT